MKKFLQINPADTVAVALQAMPGIPAGHKFALREIAEGEDVIKYGYPIGHATRAIAKGELVDHHNLATNLSGTLDYSDITPDQFSPVEAQSVLQDESEQATFLGYVRADGQVGIRNDIWVIPTVGCVNGICRQIVEQARQDIASSSALRDGIGLLYFPHNYGCSQLGDDHENTRRILRDMALHPNAGGVLVVGLGCENNQPREFEQLLGDYDCRRIRFLVCQDVEGDEVEVGAAIVRDLYSQALSDSRVRVPISNLRVGLKCGGSDGFSGITANPLLGAFTDWLCKEQGGTAILTEVPEMFGAETILMRRAVSTEVLQQTKDLINDFKQYFLSHGQPVGENPSPGNKAGGISTLEEKALGCTQKAGTVPVCGVLDYGQTLEDVALARTMTGTVGKDKEYGRPSGLYLLSAPGNDLVASTALAAAGCQLVLFTTGRGTPFSTFVPTAKISTNSILAQRKPQWIDFDAGSLLEDVPMAEVLERFIGFVARVASGLQLTKAERHGNAGFAIFKNGVTL